MTDPYAVAEAAVLLELLSEIIEERATGAKGTADAAWVQQHAQYVRDKAKVVAEVAGPGPMENAGAYSRSDWTTALRTALRVADADIEVQHQAG